jgi:hypothetical protein
MNVLAFSTPRRANWRWRIVNYAGEIVEESEASFPTISSAVAEGAKRLEHMNAIDRSTRPARYVRPRFSARDDARE